jgi:hypothetical protein
MIFLNTSFEDIKSERNGGLLFLTAHNFIIFKNCYLNNILSNEDAAIIYS